MIRVGINGFGRIGRLVLRILSEDKNVKVVGINDLMPVEQLAHLLKYDTVHGRFKGEVQVENDHLVVNGNKIRVTTIKDPRDLQWNEVKADVIMECTGLFKSREQASWHLHEGVEKVIVSAPSSDVPMYVMGVNHREITKDVKILSNASCTTNCLAPLAKVIDDHFGLKEGLMTTIHAVTASQSTVDMPAKKNMRIGRSAMNNIIPTSTGAATAVTKVIPTLKGKLTGMAFRVPTDNVSVVDLTLRTEKKTSLEEIKRSMREAAENEMKGYLYYTEDEVVSQDFRSDSHSCIFDAEASMELNSNFFKLIAWYDNEYAYAARLVDLLVYVTAL